MKPTTIIIICAASLVLGLLWHNRQRIAPKIRTVTNRIAHPGYSACGRCARTWDIVNGHDTEYDPSWSCFPLCEKCWGELKTPEARLPYYRELVNLWIEQGSKDAENKWPAIKAAVMGGK